MPKSLGEETAIRKLETKVIKLNEIEIGLLKHWTSSPRQDLALFFSLHRFDV